MTILLSKPHMSGREMAYVEEAFASNWIAPLGPNVNAFEEELGKYVDHPHTLATSSGTAALHLALLTLGIERGDVIFCQSLTFVASVNPILYVGATPVFIDSEKETWNMSPEALRKALVQAATKGKLPKAVIVVHLYGVVAKIGEIRHICQEFGVTLIEDAAESLGATWKGQMTGTIGDIGFYSFNGNKIITTSGGGMLLLSSESQRQYALKLATQARENVLHYEHEEVGYNYRLSNVSAGIGRGQLEVIEQRVRARRNVFRRYEQMFSTIDVTYQQEIPFSRANRWLTAMQVGRDIASRDQLIQQLNDEGIESRPVWKPMHLQPLYRDAEYVTVDGEDVSRHLFENGICLPSSSSLTIGEQQKVIQAVLDTRHFVKEKSV
ncbi:aminotransferase class I/II-fold pyridoxal phosphate-dependent enzyme [Exiguobacterium sp. B2(2022)]|uniref:aminotransferase class I/II-fold pyridoxal phosphate-dependent enzyme n=1 Tax=Exiguobacterium sp. B2(2022) TaxID=2992755 RepID=UPI00237B2F4E|nr:aminotransferase class I/II-fold pyridoxal phosphate-dependent enzyme [Exiguobacterium sp. B2(2022)]MDE0563269.1 aminotransferase class I/II-fold pyridoxal phosphate-dependent enzyme [Exiguobacterium sp. B2(2022)]